MLPLPERLYGCIQHFRLKSVSVFVKSVSLNTRAIAIPKMKKNKKYFSTLDNNFYQVKDNFMNVSSCRRQKFTPKSTHEYRMRPATVLTASSLNTRQSQVTLKIHYHFAQVGQQNTFARNAVNCAPKVCPIIVCQNPILCEWIYLNLGRSSRTQRHLSAFDGENKNRW